MKCPNCNSEMKLLYQFDNTLGVEKPIPPVGSTSQDYVNHIYKGSKLYKCTNLKCGKTLNIWNK